MKNFECLIHRSRPLALIMLALVLSACTSTRELMPSPNLVLRDAAYQAPGFDPAQTAPSLRILYATDRQNSQPDEANAQYNNSRSNSLAFGVAEVHFMPGVSGQDLAQGSVISTRKSKLNYANVTASELGRYTDSPYPFTVVQGKVVIDRETAAEIDRANEKFSNMLSSELKANGSNDVVLFVHGFNNSFEYAAQTLAGLWHFLGRRQVPILYSWPAGSGGIRGYFIDRESGEFTIFHLKELLRSLSAVPELKNLHIIAHSRGTDVAATALRELLIESRGTQSSLRADFRIANLIFAAPDIDYGIMRQRLMAEAFGTGFKRITVYTTENDKALSISQLLMQGIRFGLLDTDNIAQHEKSILKTVGNVDFVQAQGIKSLTGHDYFISSPAVSSDLIRVINESAKPGGLRRPLVHAGGNFWLLPVDYPGTMQFSTE